MKKIILHSFIYASVVLLAASCSKDVKTPVRKATSGNTTTTTTTGTQTQDQGGHGCGGDGGSQHYNYGGGG